MGQALLNAARDGQLGVLCELLDGGAGLEHVGDDGSTALGWAAYFGHASIVRELLARGAVVDHQSHDRETALLLAAYGGSIDVVRALLEHGAAIDHCNNLGQTALYIAAAYPLAKHEYGVAWERRAGHDEVVRELLARGAAMDTRDLDDCSAIEAAGANGNVLAVQALFTRGAELGPNAGDFAGNLLLWAATQGYAKVVSVLLDEGAPIDSTDNDGWTELMWAVSYRRYETAKLLLDRGAAVGGTAAAMFDEWLQQLEGRAEKAYEAMYEARDNARATGPYANAKDGLSDAIALARRLKRHDVETRLGERLAHIKAVFRSQFSS
jgi:ankyrin repeat protein